MPIISPCGELLAVLVVALVTMRPVVDEVIVTDVVNVVPVVEEIVVAETVLEVKLQTTRVHHTEVNVFNVVVPVTVLVLVTGYVVVDVPVEVPVTVLLLVTG